MPNTLARLWERIIEANATFYDFLLWLNEFSVRFFESEFATGLFGQNAGFGAVVEKYGWLPYFLMLFALAEAFFGRSFLKLQKFVIAFIVGFAIGTVYIAPTVSNIVEIRHFIIGIAFGLVVVVFKTPLYFATIASVLFYISYYQCINTLNFVKFWAFAISALAVILAFLFLRVWVELLGTALIGGWIFSASLALLIEYPKDHAVLIGRLITLLISALGFFVQCKRRGKRKKREKDAA